MNNLVHFLLFCNLASSIYTGIRNEDIAFWVTVVKAATSITTLAFLPFFMLKKSTIELFIVCILSSLILLIGNTFNQRFFIFLLQLLSIYSLSCILYYMNTENLHALLRKIFFYSFIILICGFLFLLFDDTLWYFESSSPVLRFSGFYGNPISWGYTNATLAVIGIYLLDTNRQILMLSMVSVLIVFMLLSATRGCLLFFCASIIIYFLRSNFKTAIVGLISTPILAFGMVSEGITKMLSWVNSAGILSGRNMIWQKALELVDFSVIRGAGFKNSGTELFNAGYRGPGFRPEATSISIHNSFVDILLGTGFLHFTFILTILLLILQRAKLIGGINISYIAAFLLICCFESILWIPFFFSTFVFFLIVFLNNLTIKADRRDSI